MVDILAGAKIHWSDVLVIILYFVIVLGVGIFSSLRSKRGSVSGYYLASRNMHWIPVGASLFASNIGSGHFVGLAGTGAKSGIGISIFELNAIFVLMILGWVFVPVYMAAGVYTMPEYLMKRFGGQRIRVYLSVLAILLYVFTKISVDIYAGAIFIKQSLGWDMYSSTIAILLVAAIFTIAGGLSAVIWTDFVQTILMVIGAFILMALSFKEVGGYDELMTKFLNSSPNMTLVSYDSNNVSCSAVPDDSLHLFRSATTSDIPWTGITFGLTISAVWYWCSDQVIVQRALAAKNLSHAKGGTLMAGILKIFPLFVIILPGMAARVLYPNEIGCANPDYCEEVCNSRSGCTNIAYPMLVIKLMPKGLRGLMLSVMLAALMSSLTSIFNSSSTLFALDIWTRIRKNASEYELLIVGRLFVVVLVIVSILWIPIIEAAQDSQLFHYIQSITSFLAPPVCAVYVIAVLWERINEKGAFSGLMTGLVVGMIRFIWEYSYTVPPCGSMEPDPRPSIIKDVHYLHFGIILFCISLIVTITVSLLTEKIPEECLYRLTFSTRFNRNVRKDISEWKNENSEEKDIEMASKSGSDENNQNGAEVKDPEIKNSEDSESDENRSPIHIRILHFICGFDPRKIQHQQTESMAKTIERKDEAINVDSIEESPRAKKICSICAIIIIVIASFIHGFYA